jgi:hypothetical protein
MVEAIETPWSIEESQEGFAGAAPAGAAGDGSLSNGLLALFSVTIGSQASGAGAAAVGAVGAVGAALEEPLEPTGFGGATDAAQSKGAIVAAAAVSLALVAWAVSSSGSVSP